MGQKAKKHIDLRELCRKFGWDYEMLVKLMESEG